MFIDSQQNQSFITNDDTAELMHSLQTKNSTPFFIPSTSFQLNNLRYDSKMVKNWVFGVSLLLKIQ